MVLQPSENYLNVDLKVEDKAVINAIKGSPSQHPHAPFKQESDIIRLTKVVTSAKGAKNRTLEVISRSMILTALKNHWVALLPSQHF